MDAALLSWSMRLVGEQTHLLLAFRASGSWGHRKGGRKPNNAARTTAALSDNAIAYPRDPFEQYCETRTCCLLPSEG